jgi:hypothetical protein
MLVVIGIDCIYSEDVPFLFQRDYGSTKCMNNKKDDLAQVLAQQGNHHALDRLMLSWFLVAMN